MADLSELNFVFDSNFSSSNSNLDIFNPCEIGDDFLFDDPMLTALSSNDTNISGIIDLQDQVSAQVGSEKGPKKTSPWHESDSGLSDTLTLSVSGSPEYMYDYDNNPEKQDLAGSSLVGESQSNIMYASSTSNDDLDDEIATYFKVDDRMLSPMSNAGSDDFSFFKHPSDADSDNDKLIDILNEDHISTQAAHSSRLQHIPSVNNPKAAVSINRASEVKILKVVRPSNSSAGVTSEDIAKAMEDRSKKNAAQAKLNREKKKAYIQSLENEVETLKSSNTAYQTENVKLKRESVEKDEEIDYLKSILANSSALASLLKNINGVKDVKLSATIMGRKRSIGNSSDDHSYNLVEGVPEKRARLINENLKKAGVCLHVSEGSACLEFCAHCSKLAKKTNAYM